MPEKTAQASPLVVGIDARLRSGESGGVEQFVIGLASGLSRLTDGPERFIFLGLHGDEDWLLPHLGGPCELLLVKGAPRDIRMAAASVKRRAVTAAPWLRTARRGLRRVKRATEGPPRPSPLSRQLEAAGARVIHFPMQSAFLTTLPSIYQPWDLQHLHLPEFFSADVIATREEFYRLFCARANIVVVASEWTRRDLVEHYDLEPSKIEVIPVPPPILAYSDLPETTARKIASELSLPETFLFYPAQTWQHKNHLGLLQALALVRDRYRTDISLVCSGLKNDHFPAIASEVYRLGLGDQVSFTGFVSPDEMQVLYRSSRALIFPSLFEGWGLPVVEAFSMGLPVACSRVTSLPELVGNAGLLFDPYDPIDIADAMWRMWTDQSLRERFKVLGHDRVRALSWIDTAKAFRARYRAVAQVELGRATADGG